MTPRRSTISGRRPLRRRNSGLRATDVPERRGAVPPGEAPVDNARIAARLEEFAALLELAGAGYYSARAYRRAAELVRSAQIPVAALVREGRVRELRGIGPGIEARLRELVETGDIAEVAELRRSTPLELAAFGRLLGIGAKRAAEIGAALGISRVAEFRQAAREGRLRDVHGIGAHTEARILAALEQEHAARPRGLLLPRARALTDQIATALGGIPAGDARRWMDSSTCLAVVVASDQPSAVGERFAALPEIVALLDPTTGITAEGFPVELVVAPAGELGTALVRATGPAEHLAALGPLPAAADEATLYRRFGLACPPPEIRDGSLEREPPALVEPAEIRGDLHAHTRWSDGRATVLEMGVAARDRGYEYLAICDHTPGVAVVPGLDGDALRRQGEEIAAANERLAPFRILRGVECDIRGDGTLDVDDDILAELDWVQLSLHRGQRAPGAQLTARVVEAMRHPAVRCLSHPTGRLIGHRPENALDLERTIEVALETGVALEVNGLPNRLDLSGQHVRVAVAAGVPIVCSTDAHSVRGLGNMELAVRTARRGRARAADVLNTRPFSELAQAGPTRSQRLPAMSRNTATRP
jgi:DNA polymerase (family 10)